MKKIIIPIILFLFLSSTLVAQDVFLKKGQYITRETGKPYTGVFREYNPDKILTAETSIKEGLLDGSSTIYYPSGAKKELREYQGGQKHGTWITWNEAGAKTAEAGFKDGKKDGFWYVWDDQGIKRYEMFYDQGEKKGTWIIRDEKGVEISREVFK